jgi:hypothetical protein
LRLDVAQLGLVNILDFPSQGDALGYFTPPRWGFGFGKTTIDPSIHQSTQHSSDYL